jgi:hypothetical protein
VIAAALILFLFLVVLVALYFRHARLTKFHAHAEYWVYTTIEELPNQDDMMKRLIGDNPYIQRGQNPIGPAEGLLFSDVRLKIALVLRSKNSNLFDPRSLPESIPDHHEFVADVGNFKSIIRLQYGSPVKLKDKRHLQFLLHASDALAEMSGATWIFDKITGSLRTQEELAEVLKANFNATKVELHVRLIETEEQTFRSFGLVKIGIPDFETHTVPPDQMQLVREVLDKYISLSWERGEAFPDPISAYDDEFILLQKRVSPTMTEMRIVRKQMI